MEVLARPRLRLIAGTLRVARDTPGIDRHDLIEICTMGLRLCCIGPAFGIDNILGRPPDLRAAGSAEGIEGRTLEFQRRRVIGVARHEEMLLDRDSSFFKPSEVRIRQLRALSNIVRGSNKTQIADVI